MNVKDVMVGFLLGVVITATCFQLRYKELERKADGIYAIAIDSTKLAMSKPDAILMMGGFPFTATVQYPAQSGGIIFATWNLLNDGVYRHSEYYAAQNLRKPLPLGCDAFKVDSPPCR
jgi:hypothetical protein